MGGFLALVIVVGMAAIGMGITFFAVCVVCDDFLVPSIDVFIDQFKIPEDVAGVTLVAFGSAAPELFLNLMSAANGTSDLSLSALLGSSIVAFGLIPPLCILMTNEKEMDLKAWPIIREIVFYLLGLLVFLFVIQDGQMTFSEAGISLGIYFLYVVGVLFVFWYYPETVGGDDKEHRGVSSTSHSMGGGGGDSKMMQVESSVSNSAAKVRVVAGHAKDEVEIQSLIAGVDDEDAGSPLATNTGFKWGTGEAGAGGMESIDDVESVVKVPKVLDRQFQSWFMTTGKQAAVTMVARAKTVWSAFTQPVHSAIHKVLPAIHLRAGNGEGNKAKVSFLRAASVLLSCVVSISLLAYCIIVLSEMLIIRIGVGTSTVGATLVALGSEIPDAISSVALARSGYYDGAMAGAIGSQVINISLGVALPTMLACFLTGESIKIDLQETRSLWLLTVLLFVVLLGYIAMTLPALRNLSCTITKYTQIQRPGARGLLILLAAVTLAFVWLNEEMIDEMEEDGTASPKPHRRLFT